MKNWTYVIAIIFIIAVSQPMSAQLEFPVIQSIAVMLYDADFDLILFEKNGFQRRSIASLTKIMTMLHVSELVQAGNLRLNDTVTASANAASRGGTQIKLRSGDTFTIEELLFASALQSANDAVVALAEHISGTEQEFSSQITNRSRELGLENTNFVDSSGLLSIYSGNYSTAFDLARLSTHAMNNSLFYQYVSTKEYFLTPQDRTIGNTNPLLNKVDGVDGIKTGTTTPAGHVLITSAVRNGRRLIVVVLGAPSRAIRNRESEELIEFAFSRLETLIPAGEVATQVRVKNGVTHLIDAVTAENVSVFFVNDDMRDQVETEVEILETQAPIERGEKIAELIIHRLGEEIMRVDLVSNQSTGLASAVRRFWNRLVGYLGWIF